MADHAFPYHLASLAVGAFATGFTVNSLKRYFARRVSSIEETAVEPHIPLLNQTRKRKRDSDATSLPPTKRRSPDAVNTSLSANRCIPSDDMSAPSPIKSVKVTSNSEQDSVEVTIGKASSRPAHHVQTRSHYGVRISFRERKHHTKHKNSHVAVSHHDDKAAMDAEDSSTEHAANEEDYHSDRTMIGDDLEQHDDGSDDAEDQSEKANRSADRDEEEHNFDVQIEGEANMETHEEHIDRADHTEKEDGLQYHDRDDDSEDNHQENGCAHKETIQIDIYRQNKKVDLEFSISNGRSDDLEILV